MRIKKFRAASVKEAMKSVKAELGANALILSNRRVAGLYEIAAAVDYDADAPVEPPPAVVVPEAGRAADLSSLAETLLRELGELKEVKELCWTLMSKGASGAAAGLERYKDELVANGIDGRLVDKILTRTFGGGGLDSARVGDRAYLRAAVRRKVFENIKVKDPAEAPGAVAFIGPPGVGKTTTLAKVAALQALKRKRKVALISMDSYRIAASEQLRTYSRLMGLPSDVAAAPGDVAGLLRKHSDKELVLIDTAGRSEKNAAHMKELKDLAGANPTMRFNLVISAESRDSSVYSTLRGYSSMPVDSITFTKLDAAPSRGQLLNAMVLAERPAAYLTAGQRVPEDIEVATRETLADFIVPA